MTVIDLKALREGLEQYEWANSRTARLAPPIGASIAVEAALRAYLAAVASDDEITAAAGSDVAFDRPGQELSQLSRADRERYLQRARAAITAAKIKSETQKQALIAAMDQVLDDMGTGGFAVCGATKAQARVALDPYLNDEERALHTPIEDARQLLKDVGL